MKKKLFCKILIVLLIVTTNMSCGGNEEFKDNIAEKSFNLDFYKNNKDEIISFLNNEHLVEMQDVSRTREENISKIIERLNEYFDSSIQLNQMDIEVVNASDLAMEWETFYKEKGYLNDKQIQIMKSFQQDLSMFDFNIAVHNMKENVLRMNISEREFEAFNLLINTLYILDYYNDQMYSGGVSSKFRKPSWWQDAGCATAIVANALATYSLVGCITPNPASPAACTTAVVGKALGLAGIAFGCM